MRYLTKQGFIVPDFKEIGFDEFYKLYPRKVGRFMAKNLLINYLKGKDC